MQVCAIDVNLLDSARVTWSLDPIMMHRLAWITCWAVVLMWLSLVVLVLFGGCSTIANTTISHAETRLLPPLLTLSLTVFFF